MNTVILLTFALPVLLHASICPTSQSWDGIGDPAMWEDKSSEGGAAGTTHSDLSGTGSKYSRFDLKVCWTRGLLQHSVQLWWHINSRAQNNSAFNYILVKRSTYIVGMRPNLCHLKFYSPLQQANILNLYESVNTSITTGGQQCSAKVSSCFMIILLRAHQRRKKPAIITDENLTLSS